MSCKNICQNHKSKQKIGVSQYADGAKYCPTCCVFLRDMQDFIYCPCCSKRLRITGESVSWRDRNYVKHFRHKPEYYKRY